MQKFCWISLAVCVVVASSAGAADLWINCEPGLEIYLDGEPAGTSDKAEFGRTLVGITTGEHTIRIEKEGVVPKEFSISVGVADNQVVVGALSRETSQVRPESSEKEPEPRPVGMIVITSDPREINVKFAGQHIPKIKPIMTFPTVHVGEHKLWFESSGTILSETVDVQEGKSVDVKVDFRNQRVAITGATPDVAGDESASEEEPQAELECIEFWIEVLRTDNLEEIEPYQQNLKELGFPRRYHKIITMDDDGAVPMYILRIGPIERAKKAKWAAGLIRNAGIPTVWILPEACETDSEQPKREFRPTH